VNWIGTEVPPRQGRRYRRHDGENRDRSIAGALPSTRTRLERYGRRLKGERRRAKRWGGHVWLARDTTPHSGSLVNVDVIESKIYERET
ncbi:hypothetical protein ALC60_08991, partial [Trachymyrmex zeteki]